MTNSFEFFKSMPYKVILGSASPRRQELLAQMGVPFKVRLNPITEDYPEKLHGEEIALFIAKQKAKPFLKSLKENELLITADTVVWHQNKHLSKAKDQNEAREMLSSLSDTWHEVITAVCFTTIEGQKLLYETTSVKFKALTEEEIAFYTGNFKPYDKAGAYGIQEWLGLIGIEEIKGSYSNVVGLPTQSVYENLRVLLAHK